MPLLAASLGVKNSMELRPEMEEKVVSAVKEFAASINSGRKVVADMSSLVDATSCLPLSNFDYWERLIRNEFSSALDSSEKPKWKFWLNQSPFLTWVDLCSWDGHRRENTLRILTGGAPNCFFFALAVRRLNDWVPQVRQAAREKLPLIAELSDPTHVVDALCITLASWSTWGRIGDDDKQVILDMLARKNIAAALKSKLISDTAGPLATIFAQVGRTASLDEYLSEIAEEAIQPSVRAKAYRSQFEGKMAWVEGRQWEWTDKRYGEGRFSPVVVERKLTANRPFRETLGKASVDRSSIVRRIAAELLIRELGHLGEDSLKFASLFASDPSLAVSERGVFALKRLEVHK